MKRRKVIVVTAVVSVTAIAGFTIARFCAPPNNEEGLQAYGESSLAKEIAFEKELLAIPKEVLDAVMREDAPWKPFPGNWPDHFIRSNGYTCGVWKWPTTTWDSERMQLSDEYRVWVKDDSAKIVSTPQFFLSRKTNAKPPRLKADKALAIAKMKTGTRFPVTNIVEDIGAFFKVVFFPTGNPNKATIGPSYSVWVSKSDWSVCGNPYSPVPALTEKEAFAAISSDGESYLYDESLPVMIDYVADLTILSLPKKIISRGGECLGSYYWISIWIDNVTRKPIDAISAPD